MKGRLLGILVLLAWGFAKVPLEVRVAETHQQLQIGNYKVMASVRQQLGQAGLLAVFGGLRSAMADLVYIAAEGVWEKAQYGKLKEYFDICTTLQPRSELYWDMASWHMAYNAAAYVQMHDAGLKDDFARQREMRKYWDLGRDYLLQGIANLPGNWYLHSQLALLYWEQYDDYYNAALEYEKADQLPGRLEFIHRFAATFLAQAPGHEQEAYDKLLALYKSGDREQLPMVLKYLQLMERKLGIPKDQRVDIPPKDRLPPE